MEKRHINLFVLYILMVALLIGCAPNMFYKNSGESISYGTPGSGSITNAYKLKFKDGNYRYFSWISYYLMGNCYVHSRLYHTLSDAYSECKETCPGKKFRIMECSDKNGGKLLIHRTHRNGLSVDFMVPKKKGKHQSKFFEKTGLFHYLLNFDAKGRLRSNKKVEIDFETMAKHIIALDNAAKKNGMTISKVILKINLKDDFFSTPSGKEVKKRGIYFARFLSKGVDRVHDDHYHVDFMLK